MESMRACIAIDIGNDIRDRLNKLQQKFKQTATDIRWVNPECIHLTLAFLGQISLERLQPLEKIPWRKCSASGTLYSRDSGCRCIRKALTPERGLGRNRCRSTAHGVAEKGG